MLKKKVKRRFCFLIVIFIYVSNILSKHAIRTLNMGIDFGDTMYFFSQNNSCLWSILVNNGHINYSEM